MKSLVLSLGFLTILISSSAFARPANGTHTPNFARPMNAACEQAKRSSCFLTLDGEARGLCQAYVEDQSCFVALDGDDRGWCQVIKEKSSCFMALNGDARGWCQVLYEGASCMMALNGEARERCENGYFEGPSREHFRWMRCSERR